MNQSEALAEVQSGALRPVYLLYGGEPFLEEELLRAMRSAIVQPETADFNYHLVDPAPDQIPSALSIARTQPFFAERRLVVVRECPAFQAARRSSADEEETQGASAQNRADTRVYNRRSHPRPTGPLGFSQ